MASWGLSRGRAHVTNWEPPPQSLGPIPRWGKVLVTELPALPGVEGMGSTALVMEMATARGACQPKTVLRAQHPSLSW